MSEPYIGRPLRRSEDAKLVTGHGQYVEDITVPGLAHLVFLRSPHAHARVTALRIDAARKASGVVRVATAADLGPLRPLPFMATLPGQQWNHDGAPRWGHEWGREWADKRAWKDRGDDRRADRGDDRGRGHGEDRGEGRGKGHDKGRD